MSEQQGLPTVGNLTVRSRWTIEPTRWDHSHEWGEPTEQRSSEPIYTRRCECGAIEYTLMGEPEPHVNLTEDERQAVLAALDRMNVTGWVTEQDHDTGDPIQVQVSDTDIAGGVLAALSEYVAAKMERAWSEGYGSLVETWDEVFASRGEDPPVDADLAAHQIAKWLSRLPGDAWDTRLPG